MGRRATRRGCHGIRLRLHKAAVTNYTLVRSTHKPGFNLKKNTANYAKTKSWISAISRGTKQQERRRQRRNVTNRKQAVHTLASQILLRRTIINATRLHLSRTPPQDNPPRRPLSPTPPPPQPLPATHSASAVKNSGDDRAFPVLPLFVYIQAPTDMCFKEQETPSSFLKAQTTVQ